MGRKQAVEVAGDRMGCLCTGEEHVGLCPQGRLRIVIDEPGNVRDRDQQSRHDCRLANGRRPEQPEACPDEFARARHACDDPDVAGRVDRPRMGGTASTRRTASAIQSPHIIAVTGSLTAGDSARTAISARVSTA